ncbi:F0F1 ATP synthase subunit B [Hoeflea sp. YIM 152468]|uniref:F0F1 ATP synthase subunit B n=1 Tax=Hoeflea sp. YIM 152468 TaxID=3031759 RepID=UPI0023DC1672|nr:F0F1 ATP synthase subunit B [Hoeflea sp. YIM 152468]MDF1606629.1 F0F1 ATP synthase subunit B [Hoeflea sp. YIM 152468]
MFVVTPAYAESNPTEGTISETGAHEGDAQGGGVFPPFDSSTFASQLLWLAITFGLFYLFMSKVIVPRIGSILEHRRDRIAQDLDEANRLKEEGDAAIAAYEQELADARKKASVIAETAREKAKAAAEAERVSTEAELGAKMAEAEKSISAIKAKALADVDTIAEDAASDVVQHLLGGTVTKAEIAAAIRAASGK